MDSPAALPGLLLHLSSYKRLKTKGFTLVYLTPSCRTLAPPVLVSVDDDQHEMHSEFYQLSEEVAQTSFDKSKRGTLHRCCWDHFIRTLVTPKIVSMERYKPTLVGPISLSNQANSGRLSTPFQPTSTYQINLVMLVSAFAVSRTHLTSDNTPSTKHRF